MNNNYFYKLASIADRIDWMRKVAQTTDSIAQEPAAAPTTTAPTPSTLNTTASTTSTPGTATQTTPASAPKPTPVRSPGPGDEKFIPKNATELYNHWVAQKENFYRKRAEDPNDKFGSRYANYTVSREAQKGLEREAKDLFDRFNRGDIDQAELERYFTREGAFNSAMDRYQQERDERQQKQQEQSAGAPMQNPSATAAIPNPSLNYSNTGSPTQQSQSIQPANAPGQQDLSMHTPRAGAIIRQNGLPAYAQTFQDMLKFSEAWIKQYGYNPDSLSSASREYREAMRQYGSKLYPYYPGMTSFSQYAQDSINNGVGIYGDAQDRINQLDAAYIDSKHFPEYSYGPGWEQALQNYIGHKDNPWNQYSYF